jgi:diguanylate cyclase (GGDEF)-like protein
MDKPLNYQPAAVPASSHLLLRCFYNFFNSGITEGVTLEVRYVNAITLIGLFNVTISIFIESFLGKAYIAGFMFSMATLAILNILLLRKSHNVSLAASILLLITLTMFSVMLLDGMYQNTALIWSTIFPAIAFFFKGKLKGVAWVSAQLGIVLLIMLGQEHGYIHSPFSNSALGLLMLCTITIGMMVFVYESMRAKAEAALRQAREELHHQAHTDMLTGLPNRAAFYSQLPMAISQSQRNKDILAVLFIDLDNFKPINDTYGHEAGDELLQQAATRLRMRLRGSDYIARFGGDEFVAILPGIHEKEEIGVIAEKLISALGAPFIIGRHTCNIGVSIGIGVYPHCAADVDELVQLADHAMYSAKLSGKNGYSMCPILQSDDTSPYQGKCTCNRSCQEELADQAII